MLTGWHKNKITAFLLQLNRGIAQQLISTMSVFVKVSAVQTVIAKENRSVAVMDVGVSVVHLSEKVLFLRAKFLI